MSWQKYEAVMKSITDSFIAEIEAGTLEWKKMWTAHWPMNVQSKKLYRGFNAMLLQYLTNQKGYRYPFYITYKGAKSMGGQITRGQSGTQVIFWKHYEDEKTKEKKLIPYTWTVFNIDQCEGIEFDTPEDLIIKDYAPIDLAEDIFTGYKGRPKVVNQEKGRAFYSPMNDFINMPEMGSFSKIEAYYQVLFHEAVHSTGHHTRLNRFKSNISAPFASVEYSKEELIAELGASFLCHHAGILNENFKNSAAYLQGWVSEFKEKPTMLYSAMNSSMKAVQLILGIEDEIDNNLNPKNHE
jgi:antirestriction protein ArdC